MRGSSGPYRFGLSLRDASLNVVIVVAMKIRHTYEVKDCEAGLADVVGLARPTAPHLPVENTALGEPGHHQIDHLRAVEAGIEHVHADQNLRKLLLLETLDDGARIRSRPVAHIADHKIGEACRWIRLQICKVLVEHLCKRLRMASRHSEHDGLAPRPDNA